MENITECEEFGGDYLSGSIAVLDSNVVELEGSVSGGWMSSLG